MSYSKREKRRLLKIKFRISLISFIFLYLILRSAPIIFADNLKTTLPVVETLKEEFKSKAVIIKDEEVFQFDRQAVVEKEIEEGEKVRVGINVANLNFLKDISSLKYELEEVENSIKVLKEKNNTDKVFQKDKEDIIKNKEVLINNIQNNIINGNFEEITYLNNSLNFYYEKDSKIFNNKNLIGNSLKTLEEKREDLKQKISGNNVSYKTKISGILSYDIDGYENIYIPKDFENYTYKNLDLSQDKKLDSEFIGFKIIDNFNWYMAIKIENADNIKHYKVNDIMNINLLDDNRKLAGKIIQINKTGKKGVVILKLRNYLYDYYKLRFVDLNIVNSSKEGFKIPTNTIIEIEGQKGVYIKDFNGIVKFKPIIIIGEEDEYTFLDRGKSGYIDIPSQKEAVKTIGLYDEIFLKPNKVVEGQIIN